MDVTDSTHYSATAMDRDIWPNHSVGEERLTIIPVVHTDVTERREIEITVDLTALFSRVIPSNDKDESQGPFIDETEIAITPNDTSTEWSTSSHPATPVREWNATTSRGQTTTLNARVAQRDGFISQQFSSSNSVTGVAQEFEPNVSMSGSKKMWTLSLAYCYDYDGMPQRYEVANVGTLRKDNSLERVGFGLIPIFGWFGGFLLVRDYTYKPPECSRSSINQNVTSRFVVPHDSTEVSFQVDCRVRVVYASTASTTMHPNAFKTNLNWIVSTHSCSHTLTVNTRTGQSRKRRISGRCISSTGHEDRQV